MGDRIVVPFTIMLRRVRAVPPRQLLRLRAQQPQQGARPTSCSAIRTAGLFGYTHLTGGYAGGQAEYLRVPYADKYRTVKVSRKG